jgi:hypothetical protein
MSSVGRAVSNAAPPQERREGYAFCAKDGFWFRPNYTDGKCPLCGAAAPGEAPPPSMLGRMGRSWLGLAGLALLSLVMLALVLVMYFRG